MALPTVRINTYVQPTVKSFVDSITKAYIIGELLFGVNRLSIITEKRIYIILGLIYSGLILCGIVCISVIYHEYLSNFFVFVNVLLYILCIINSFIFYKRMHRFYNELNNFDIQVCCRPKFVRGSVKNLIQACVVILYIIIIFSLPYQVKILAKILIYLFPTHITQTFEVHYYGHLLNLLIPRLRLINYYMHILLNKDIDMKESILKELIFFKNYDKKKNCNMKKIMDLYYVIVKSYNYLIEGIKWQMLLIIITSFISVLGFCYHFSLKIIEPSNEHPLGNFVTNSSLTMIVMIPLFAPCMFADRVHDEVRRLRELLASVLYENKLDKSSRSIARSLLAFTETRNLSFTLLRIVNIDISLPFKFVGLLVTYLIILLQFKKVLHP